MEAILTHLGAREPTMPGGEQSRAKREEGCCMSQETRLYVVRHGRNGEDEEQALDEGIAVIGWYEVPSLAHKTNRQDIRQCVSTAYPDAPTRRLSYYARSLFLFAVEMEEGDLIVLPRKRTSQIAIGRVAGPYEYRPLDGVNRHTRRVEWLRPDLPRPTFGQDLLYSFGGLGTVYEVSRNDAARRVVAVAEGHPDPRLPVVPSPMPDLDELQEDAPDFSQAAHDQIVEYIQVRFVGYALEDLVAAILDADGWGSVVTQRSRDGGVDILAGRGPLGLDEPRLCVQVKSQQSKADITVYRSLHSAMHTFQAKQALLVCWGGFNDAVKQEAKTAHFTVRLWDRRDLVKAIYRTYDRLSEEMRAQLPLQRVWMLVPDNPEG